jgi:WD40 repeat protein
METARATASTAAQATGPYVGLRYYTEADAEWFFGRDEEAQTIIGNLRAARLTILYAKSGVGKSSLLRAGVSRRVHELGAKLSARSLTGYVPVVFNAWKDDPVEELVAEIERAIGRSASENARLPRALRDSIITAAAVADAELLIILDQFEEYLLYQARESAEHSFVDELAACVNARDLPANFLIAIRDDAYSSLGDLFAGKLANVYSNYLELRPLGPEAARAAIEMPLKRFGELHHLDQAIGAEPELVKAVLKGVRPEEDDRGSEQGNTGGNGSRASLDEIEAPYLQLVMSALWERERARGSYVLRLATLEELGGARAIIRTHLDGELDALDPEDYETALAIFGYLVTPSGTKIVYAASDLAESVERPYDRVAALLAYLAREDKRIVRHVPPPAGKAKPDDRYEIFHDVLGRPIVDWRRRALEQRKRAAEEGERRRLESEKRAAEERTTVEERRRRWFQRLAAASTLLLVIAVGLGIWALVERQNAVSNVEAARASQIVAGAEQALPQDPQLSMLLALQALHLRHSAQAEAALLEALPQVQELRLVRIGAPVDSAAFSPDGSSILTADESGTATILDLANGRRTRLVDERRAAVNTAAFNRDATRVVTASKDGAAVIWNAVTGRPVLSLPRQSEEVDDAAFSPDGTKVVTANKGGDAIVWNAASGKQITTLRLAGHTGAFDSAVFSPDGTKVLTANESGTANVWDAATGQALVTLRGHLASVSTAAFDQSGTRIVTAGEDGTARIWEASSGRQLLAFSVPTGAVQSAVFSRDGTEVVTAEQNRGAAVWDAATGKQLLALNCDCGPIRWAAFSPDGRQVVTAGEDGTARIWDGWPREQLATLRAGQGEVDDAAFDPSGTRIITANQNDTATIWDVARHAPLAQLTGHRGPVYTAAFSPDGTLALTASRDGTARLWNAQNGKQLKLLASNSGYLNSAAFSPNGKEVITASKAGDVTIWSTRGERLETLRPNAGSVEDAVFSPSGTTVASADENGTVTVWTLAEPARSSKLDVSSVAVLSVAFNRAGTEFVTAGKDGIARVWAAGAHRPRLMLPSRGGPIFSAAFSPDGRDLVTADENGDIRIWDVRDGHQLAVLDAHEGVLLSAAFSPTGGTLVTASAAGDAAIWTTELAGSRSGIERIAAGRETRRLTTQERARYLPK